MTTVEESQLLTDQGDFEFDTQNSYLFSHNAQESNELEEEDIFATSKSILFQDVEENQNENNMELDDIANEEEQNEQLESNTVQDYSPVMHASKTVKLFSGEVIKLSPRVFNTTTIDETQLKGTYMDMDSLTTRANLRNSIKNKIEENKWKIQHLLRKTASTIQDLDREV